MRPGWHLKIPPPIWSLAMLLMAYAIQTGFVWGSVVEMRSTTIAIGLVISGIAIAVWAERMFAAAGTEIMPASPANKALVTRGPFGYTRNPMYSGLILVALGIALYFGTLPFFAVPVLLFLLTNFVFIPF